MIKWFSPMGKKILITGAGGYIGSNAAELFLKDGFEVVGLDNFKHGFKAPLKLLQKKYGQDKLKYYKKDLRDDLSEIFHQEKDILVVVHFAALLSVDESMKDPQEYFSNNVTGTINLLTSMIKNNVKNIVFSSTCATYGDAKYVPIDEVHPQDPTNVYGQTKLMIEQTIKWYQKLLGLNYVIFRYFNVCGASDDSEFGYSKTPSTLLVMNAVKGALGIEPFYLTCPEVDTKDKTPIRDYINVVDLSVAHLKAVNYLMEGGKSEVINLGTGTGNSVLEIVEKVQEITGVKFDINKTTPREGEYAVAIADIKKAKRVLDWEPKRSLELSIQTLVKWYKANPKGWKE